MTTETTTRVETAGRRDLDDFFRLSGVLSQRLTHTPILAFLVDGAAVTVRIVDRAADAAALPAGTPLMAQWSGRWRSDFFRFTAGDLRAALDGRRDGGG